MIGQRQRQKADSRGRILSAARHLFATRGFHQTAMSELASEAQVSVGQIYRSFKNKNDIILAIVSDDIVEMLGDLEDVLGPVKSGGMSIHAAFEKLVSDSLSDTDDGLAFEILAEAHRNPLVADEISDLLRPCRATLRALVSETNPSLGDAELDAAEEFLLACLFGLGHCPLSRKERDVRESIPDIVRMMVKALQT